MSRTVNFSLFRKETNVFQLTKTFINESLRVTPILMEGNPVFLAQELGEQFGYADLSNSIRTSRGFVEDNDYIVIDGEKLNHLRDILRVGNTHSQNLQSSNTDAQISPMARSVTIITESGFSGLAFRSDKPECVRFRLWVTHEVLPSIRRTGTYTATGADMQQITKTLEAAKEAAKMLGASEKTARRKAVEAVRKIHQVDVYGLLGETDSRQTYQTILDFFKANRSHFGELVGRWAVPPAEQPAFGYIYPAKNVILVAPDRLCELFGVKSMLYDIRRWMNIMSPLKRDGLIVVSKKVLCKKKTLREGHHTQVKPFVFLKVTADIFGEVSTKEPRNGDLVEKLKMRAMVFTGGWTDFSDRNQVYRAKRKGHLREEDIPILKSALRRESENEPSPETN